MDYLGINFRTNKSDVKTSKNIAFKYFHILVVSIRIDYEVYDGIGHDKILKESTVIADIVSLMNNTHQ